jgi:hypothetical protein
VKAWQEKLETTPWLSTSRGAYIASGTRFTDD